MVRSPGNSWKVIWHETPPAADIHFIIGFMGAGKTTLAQELSMLWKLPMFDTDQMIEAQTGLSITEIFNKHGEVYFRKLESDLIESLPKGTTAIYSCGGGLPCFANNLALLKQSGTVWWLNTPLETIIQRISGDEQRPLAQYSDKSALLKLYENRLPFYRAAHAEILIA